jgi:catechol 2,3-dioxygenase-like lactoylglutathione lyase family enzyme
MTATPKFAHVVLQTSRFEEMRDWYCTVLDAHVVYEGHGLCFITFDEEHHRVALLGALRSVTQRLVAHQTPLPVPRNGAIGGFGGAFADHDVLGDMPLRLEAVAGVGAPTACSSPQRLEFRLGR